MRNTPLQSLLETRLGRSLREHVYEARAAGKSWRTIARDISETTGRRVTGETVRDWFSDEAEAVVSDALREAALRASA